MNCYAHLNGNLPRTVAIVQVLSYDFHMAPTSAEKSRQFSFTLSEEEHKMLLELAREDNRSAANWIRYQIYLNHKALQETAPLRAVADRLSGKGKPKKKRTK
jgi:hypothetical protein